MKGQVAMGTVFKDFFEKVEPIKFREPLAETLGAFKGEDSVLEYSFVDTVKMAGHACPTVAGAYLCCQKALEKLYPGEIPVRGEIAVTVYGEQDEGVCGVIGQVFGFLTGAAPASGFKGLSIKFKRKDLLKYSAEKIDPAALCFEFRRLDNNAAVLVKFYPQRIPFSPAKSERMGDLIQKVIWEAARKEELEEFRGLWMEKVEQMLLEKKELGKWLLTENVK